MKAITSMNANMSVQDTNVLKGLAILLLLCHHLFYVQNGLFDDIHLYGDHYLVNELGKFSKLCVVLFVFLSGYGLTVQAERKGGISNIKEFYAHRQKKLLLNYWLIWLIFVPISYFCFDMTFEKAYQHNVEFHLVLDILGIHALFYSGKVLCYNPTWWFMSTVIVLYLLFPLMYKMMKKDSLMLILFTLIVSFLPIPFIDVIKFNIVAFSLGMWMVTVKSIPPRTRQGVWLVMLLLLLYAVERNANRYPLIIDCVLALLIAILYQYVNCPKWIKMVMAFLGKHSMNIFLFHTFIFFFWFHYFVYASRNPIIIILTLLAICIPISLVLEWIKKYTINKL